MWHLKWNFRLTKTLTSASFSNTFFDLSKLGKYKSGTIDYTPFIPNPNLDMKSQSSFSQREVNEYQVDYNAEIYRKNHERTKLYPSRFGCIFAFGSMKEARNASEIYNWNINDVSMFKLNKAAPNRVVKVNMQIITQMWNIGNGASFSLEENEKIWEHYWCGKAELALEVPNLKTGKGSQIINEGVVWEYLVDGQLELVQE